MKDDAFRSAVASPAEPTCLAGQDQPEEGVRQPERRSREEVLREIKLALTVGDGLLLEDERSRGFDPYDSHRGGRRREVWQARRRG